MRLMIHLFLALLLTLFACSGQRNGPPAEGEHVQKVASLPAPDSLSAHIRALLADTAAGAQRRLPLSLSDAKAARAFYARHAYAPAWSDSLLPSAAGRAALALPAQAADYGLQPRLYHAPALQALADSLAQPAALASRRAQQARFEVLLTDGVVRFALHLRRGQLHAFTASPLEQAGVPFEPAAWVAGALAAPDFAAALLGCQPPQREYRQLQQALARWRQAPAGPDSLVRGRRAQQLALTLERWRWAAIPDSAYVLVNLPAYALEVVGQGRVLQTHRLVIGKPGSPTPTLSSRLASFTLAPAWHVPHSIAVKEMLPHLRAGTAFIAENNYAIFDAQGRAVDPASVNWQAVTAQHFPYTIRQNPGCGNALGNIIFRFANPYDVYLHSTSGTKDFAQAYRALGHGCMRMERPMRLAAYLLGPDSTRAALPTEAECEAAPRSRSFVLRRPVPLHVRYATCAVVAGQLRFYADVYGRDEAVRRQLFGR